MELNTFMQKTKLSNIFMTLGTGKDFLDMTQESRAQKVNASASIKMKNICAMVIPWGRHRTDGRREYLQQIKQMKGYIQNMQRTIN